MRRALYSSAILLAVTATGFTQDKKSTTKDPSRVLPAGQLPKDARLGKPRTLRDAYHPWTPPKTLAEWKKERKRLREQVLVSQGLWPMPPRTPLKPVVHGKIDRGDYTVERVFFQSHPGHYVTGNLYRPKKVGQAFQPDANGRRTRNTQTAFRQAGKPDLRKFPGVLCPHGHWGDARFYDAGVKKAKKLIAGGGETYLNAARHHIQARVVGLARLGCVVFHYDMVGYSDSKVIDHRQGFKDAAASLRLQNFMGLQTWNSIRALDFLTSLPDVDTKRIGVTGASGGGTQTFMLAAIDPRVTVAFPAVMVSTAMQGGCVCENAEYLRIGINNIALAALFAPKPQAMSGADDWTKAIETRGYPELRQVYSLYGLPGNIAAKAFPQFKHNYNQVAREMMYEWFNRHLKLGHKSPIRERDFKPVSRKDLTVFDADHPQPKNAKSAVDLKKYLTKVSETQFKKLVPKTKADVKRYREVVGAAARVMFGEIRYERHIDIDPKKVKIADKKLSQPVVLWKGLLPRDDGTAMPVLCLHWGDRPQKGDVYWFDTSGKIHLFDKVGLPTNALRKLITANYLICSADLFLTGEYLAGKLPTRRDVNSSYAGYTFGYNRPLLAERIRDAQKTFTADKKDRPFHLIGTGDAGVWTLLAAAQLGKKVNRIIVDLNGFSFRNIKSTSDPNFLPGALKYGGIGGLAALAAPTELVLYGTKDIPVEELAPLIQVYKVTGGKLTLHSGKLTDALVVKEVLKK